MDPSRFSAVADIFLQPDRRGSFSKIPDLPCKHWVEFVEENSARRYNPPYLCSPWVFTLSWWPTLDLHQFVTDFSQIFSLAYVVSVSGQKVPGSCFSLQTPSYFIFQVTWLSYEICSLVGSTKVTDLQLSSFSFL